MQAKKTHFVLSDENKSTLKWIAAGMLIFGAAFFIRSVYINQGTRVRGPKNSTVTEKQNQKTRLKSTPTPQRLHTKVTQYSEFYFDKDMQIQNIKAFISESPTVEDIYLNSPVIARDEFIKYTYEMRRRRRLIRKVNEDQYINTIITYEAQTQELLLRSRLELLEQFGMDPEIFENMEENYEAIQDLRALHRKAEQTLKSKLLIDTKPKKLSLEMLHQIIQSELNFMHNKMYERLKQKLQQEMKIDQNEILTIIETLLEDIIYQKFGYQREDIARKMEEIGYDAKQLKQARRQMEIHISDFKNDSESQSHQEHSEELKLPPTAKSSANSLQESGNF